MTADLGQAHHAARNSPRTRPSRQTLRNRSQPATRNGPTGGPIHTRPNSAERWALIPTWIPQIKSCKCGISGVRFNVSPESMAGKRGDSSRMKGRARLWFPVFSPLDFFNFLHNNDSILQDVLEGMREVGWGRELAVETIKSIITSKRQIAAQRRKKEVARQRRSSEAREDPQSEEMQRHTSSGPAEPDSPRRSTEPGNGAHELMEMVQTSNSCHQRSG